MLFRSRRHSVLSVCCCQSEGRIFLGAGNHSEDWLQKLLFIHPELLPLAQIEPGLGAPVPAAREVVCAHGAIDNLYLTAVTLFPQHAEAWTKIIESVLGELRCRAEAEA